MVVEQKLEALRTEVNTRFGEVRTDIRELTQALRELIRLDGDIKRLQDATTRIGKVVDQHDEEISNLKLVTNTASNTVGVHERWFWIIAAAVIGILSSLSVKFF